MIGNLKKKIRSRAPFLKMSDRDFLERVYREILGREIDADGLARYTRMLREGHDRWGVILLLIRSEEFKDKTVRERTERSSDQAFLERLYPIFYGREIDAEGRRIYSRLLEKSHDRISIVAILAKSEEFINRVLRENLPLEDIRPLRPDCYRVAEDFIQKASIQVFEAKGPEDFDWLEGMILEKGYYERPGIWSFDLDLDKKVTAEILALFAPRRCLEFGCANGAVLQALAQRDIAGEGVEISAMSKTRAFPEVKNRIHLGDLLSLDLPSDYDLVYGLDILEHLNPNKLAAYLARIRDLLGEGGYCYCNVPAFGSDPVFGTIFPLYVKEWEGECSDGRPFQTLPVDEMGYPIHGHLIWADTAWWVRQFETAGLVREPELERAIHQKYDPYWEVAALARRSFYVFSKQGRKLETRRIQENVLRSSSEVLAEFRGNGREAR
jgi:SAM-dependent methyltransferase